MQCLVCNAAAKDLTPKDFDGWVIRCPKCGKYEVAENAVYGLSQMPFLDRADALKKAISFKTRVPAITTICL